MSNCKKEKGFTIIEVVLVLAIAGLIFLMVFIALPALQRSQRDTQRKNDLARLNTALTSYQSNNKGKLPSASTAGTENEAWAKSLKNYVTNGTDDNFNDPSSGAAYVINHNTAKPDTMEFSTTNPTIQAVVGATCDGEDVTLEQGGRKVAFLMKLEGNGTACVNN